MYYVQYICFRPLRCRNIGCDALLQGSGHFILDGPEGLLKGKKVYVALARGGLYRDTPADSQVPYLKSVLGFIGMNDIEFIYAEGLAMGAESADRAFAEADAHIEALFA